MENVTMPPAVRQKLQAWLDVQIREEVKYLAYPDLQAAGERAHAGRLAALRMVRSFLGARFDLYRGHLRKRAHVE